MFFKFNHFLKILYFSLNLIIFIGFDNLDDRSKYKSVNHNLNILLIFFKFNNFLKIRNFHLQKNNIFDQLVEFLLQNMLFFNFVTKKLDF